MTLARLSATTFSVLVLIFLLAPLIVVIPVSFTAGSSLTFPPQGFSTRWYFEFFGDPAWLSALWLSIRLATLSAFFATIVGLLAAFAMRNYIGLKARSMVLTLALLPFIVPKIIVALSVFQLTDLIGIRGGFWSLVLGHTILTLPFSVILIDSALQRFNLDLLLAGLGLGASPLYVARRILLPLLMPSILGAAVFAFVMSWDELIIALIVGSVYTRTLTVLMFEFLQTRIEPTVAAVSGLLVLAGVLGLLTQELLSKLWKRRTKRFG